MNNANILAKSLKAQGVEYVFGVVGIPIIEVAIALQAEGLQFFGMRNEQAASYAACAIGYLSGRPGVCLVVSGPGVVHAMAGLAHACDNGWPAIVLGGASDNELIGSGAFQECNQMSIAMPVSKFCATIISGTRIPFIVEKAVRKSCYGRPGGVYLDFPGDLVNKEVDESALVWPSFCPDPPLSYANNDAVLAAVNLLASASAPLIIIGKGAALGRAEKEVLELVTTTKIPFLPTPMGKGVLSDTHPFCVGAARTAALVGADVILLLGARLNWQLHFGLPPRFRSDVKIIQVELMAEEFHQNISTTIPLLGHVRGVVQQLVSAVKKNNNLPYSLESAWWHHMNETVTLNLSKIQRLISDREPLNYYTVFHHVKNFLTDDTIIVSEGANTMDIGRAMLPNGLPRHRLDAGTFGTMGVGLGFALAAAVWASDHSPKSRVLAVEGDSAVGFSLCELESLVRYRLAVIILVVNNGGIGGGMEAEDWRNMADERSSSELARSLPPTCLSPGVRYDEAARALGCHAHVADNVKQLIAALTSAFNDGLHQRLPHLINVNIEPSAQRREQTFDWLSRAKI